MDGSPRPLVCIQGLGFVGAAMAAAVAAARRDGHPAFDVIGIDLPNGRGEAAVKSINAGCFPFATLDPALDEAVAQGRRIGNLTATTDPAAYEKAAVVCIDVQLDVALDEAVPRADLSVLINAAETLASRIPAGCLVLVETTVPPGTCEKVLLPILRRGFEARGLDPRQVRLAHSYERVMPGEDYLDSIVNYWRAYSGSDEESAAACASFLSAVINVRDFPLTRLSSLTASETAKVLENSYRATTIAFMEEWGRFAEAVGIDMYEIVGAIRKRPTHSNMRTPGFGVGGYCLTKDPLLPGIAARDLFGLPLDFPLSQQAVAINRRMPLVSLALLQEMLGPIAGKTILLCGISYRPGVADTRYSPAETIVAAMEAQGARVLLSDPLVGSWAELGRDVPRTLPDPQGIDAVIFAVGHREYRAADLAAWLDGRRPAVLDASDVLSEEQRQALRRAGCLVRSIGRGDAS